MFPFLSLPEMFYILDLISESGLTASLMKTLFVGSTRSVRVKSDRCFYKYPDFLNQIFGDDLRWRNSEALMNPQTPPETTDDQLLHLPDGHNLLMMSLCFINILLYGLIMRRCSY